MIRSWRLDGERQSLVLSSTENRLAQIIYWGPRLPDDEDVSMLYKAGSLDVTGGMLDQNPELSISPEASRNFPGQVGMVLRDQSGVPIVTKFRFVDADQTDQSLTLIYRDETYELIYTAEFSINLSTNILTASASLASQKVIIVDWMSAPVFPAPQNSDKIYDFSGRWCGEFQMQETPWSAGVRYRENTTGRTGHEHFPGLIVPVRGAKNTAGHAYAFHYGWSGGHKMVAEELADGRRQIQFGHASYSQKRAQNVFKTATLYCTFSDVGINGCAVAFQRHVRDEIVCFPKSRKQRPVFYNCWEAVYFNHDVDELKEIASLAASLGAERFVLDDGWFVGRVDDTRSLSDWVVDPEKYPQGLNPLIEHVHAEGMSFGLWFEPEMINRNSHTYRAHPEWVLGDLDQIMGRQQLVLDMSLSAVCNYLFDCIDIMLKNHDIAYIKWDHNRVLPIQDIAQIEGTYALLDRLREAHPDVEIESCASGGGRIDFGILNKTQRVWLSDSNDALERLKIQHNAALFLPLVVTGSHVGPRISHTSGRNIDIRLRAWVAAQRHMGFEMDPRELSEDEAAVLKDVTRWWRDNRDWMVDADILRLDSADPAVIAEQQLSKKGDKFLVFAGKVATSTQIAPRPLCLTNLDPNAIYHIDLVNRDEAQNLSRGDQVIKQMPLHLSGAYLMGHGITLPWSFPETIWVVKGSLQ